MSGVPWHQSHRPPAGPGARPAPPRAPRPGGGCAAGRARPGGSCPAPWGPVLPGERSRGSAGLRPRLPPPLTAAALPAFAAPSGERSRGSGGCSPRRAARGVCRRGKSCSSGELRLSLSHSIFLLLVKPLYVATSITSHDSCFTPLPTWSLTLLVKIVNRFDFLKQIIICVIPPSCLYSFHSFQRVNIGYYFSRRK